MKNRINIVRYTYDAWMKCNPDSDYSEWYFVMKPNHLFGFIREKLEFYENVTGLDFVGWNIRIVMLDNEYIDWLKKNRLDDSQKNAQKYARELTDAKVNDLFAKNKLDYEDTLLYLHLLMASENIFGKSTKYKLTNENIQELKNYLMKVYVSSNVYIPGYFLTAEMTELCEEDMLEEASAFFEKAEIKQNKKYFKQIYDYDNGNLNQLYVPFIIRNKIASPIIEADNFIGFNYHENYLAMNPEKIVFESEITDLYGLYDVDNINESKFAKSIQNAFKNFNLLWHQMPVTTDEVSDVENMYIELLENDLEDLVESFDDDFDAIDGFGKTNNKCKIIKFFDDDEDD